MLNFIGRLYFLEKLFQWFTYNVNHRHKSSRRQLNWQFLQVPGHTTIVLVDLVDELLRGRLKLIHKSRNFENFRDLTLLPTTLLSICYRSQFEKFELHYRQKYVAYMFVDLKRVFQSCDEIRTLMQRNFCWVICAATTKWKN